MDPKELSPYMRLFCGIAVGRITSKSIDSGFLPTEVDEERLAKLRKQGYGIREASNIMGTDYLATRQANKRLLRRGVIKPQPRNIPHPGIKEDEVIKHYLSFKSVDALAEFLDVPASSLKRYCKKLKEAGKLPKSRTQPMPEQV